MTNLMETFENKQIAKLTSKKRIPAFRPGDTLKVTIKITEGEKFRLQSFEGMCIARKNNSINSNFTVRKISHGEGVEKVFPLFSPIIETIKVVRKGDVRRAKLYYLRNLTGKSARIADRDRGDEIDQYEFFEEDQTKKENKEVEEKNNIEALVNEKNEEEKKVEGVKENSKIAVNTNASEPVVKDTEQKLDEQQS